MFDVVIAGGGPAGMNAALMLGRTGRAVLLADAGQPRNAASPALHGFLSRDGADPAEVRRIARADLGRYPSVQVRDTAVETAAPAGGGFEVTTAEPDQARARRLLLATGMADQLPPVPGLAALWGRAVFHCPYCHGWEVRGQDVAVLGGDDMAAHLALELRRLGCDVVLCTDGPPQAGETARSALAAHGVRVCEDPVGKVEGEPGRYVRLHLAPGWTLERRALFVRAPLQQRSGLAAQLGCTLLSDGAVQVNDLGQTTVPGVYAAGDMCHTPALPFPAAQVVIGAAKGALAAIAIDQDLMFNDAYGTGGIPGASAAAGPARAAARRDAMRS